MSLDPLEAQARARRVVAEHFGMTVGRSTAMERLIVAYMEHGPLDAGTERTICIEAARHALRAIEERAHRRGRGA